MITKAYRALGLWLLALLALAGIGAATAPTHRSAIPRPQLAARSADTVRASVVCPDLRILPNVLGTTVAVGAGLPGAGSVHLVPASGNAAGPVGPVLANGKQVGRYGGPLTGPLTLTAQGPIAGSLVAEQLSRGNQATDRGWAEARCEPPRAQQWFVGAATTPGDTPVLVLANPTDTPAVADISVLTAQGITEPRAGHNLTLGPRTVIRLDLGNLAPNFPVTAVEVATSSGRVSAAVRDVRSSGETPLGTDWVPVGGAATELTIAGFPGTVTGAAPRRVVYVGAPGVTDATVRVQVTTSSGTFVPVGEDAITVTAGTLRSIDLTALLGASAGSVTVTSDDPDVPIVAGGFVDASSAKPQHVHEIAFLGPAAPLRGAALVPIVVISAEVDSVLVLSAPRQSVSATLVITPPKGPVLRRRVVVNAGRTLEQSLRMLKIADRSTVTVLPDAGSPPLYAVRLIEEDSSRGPLLSAFTLLGAPPSQPVPAIRALSANES